MCGTTARGTVAAGPLTAPVPRRGTRVTAAVRRVKAPVSCKSAATRAARRRRASQSPLRSPAPGACADVGLFVGSIAVCARLRQLVPFHPATPATPQLGPSALPSGGHPSPQLVISAPRSALERPCSNGPSGSCIGRPAGAARTIERNDPCRVRTCTTTPAGPRAHETISGAIRS